MSAAFVIEVRGLQAGLVVRNIRGGFRFFASVAEAGVLEGRVFRSAAHARQAVEAALDADGVRSGPAAKRGAGAVS